MTWFMRALIAMTCFVPMFVTIRIMSKFYATKPEVSLALWGIGVALGVTGWLIFVGRSVELAPTPPRLVVLAMGVVIGTLGNVMLFQSVNMAPNPGMAAAVVNTNAVATFLVMPLLALLLPKVFERGSFSWTQLFYVLLVTAGTVGLALKG